MRTGFTIALGAALFCAVSASAAEPKSADRVLRDFGTCRSTPDAAARLACFEKTFDSFEQAVKSKEVTIVDKADMRQAKRSLFGFTLPKLDLFNGDGAKADKADEFSEINTTVASARAVDNGRAEITLADESGAVWRTTDPMKWPPRPGDKIRIREASLGSYFLSMGGRSYRGLRVR
ncbi:hypothetical protein HL653_19570 [Sphingomonas sp. AP4-R1]|uniref:hypothetical protein n=1 Tax=Sphingomonas sp. AP4-R1 TaxID=2735134 RepID=UPI00149355F2|nr:hypothetical protein [Sphingomonas sp. AP4-R1]QJU59660.1 hypothetical protein HL653_19570 [Sphingomonas sp. AP4-R1]